MRKIMILFSAILLGAAMALPAGAAEAITCWFPPAWMSKGSQARAITEALSQHAGLAIKPRIAKSYPEILEAFSTNDQALVYVGSFVQAVINARKLGVPLVQNVNGREFYSGVLIYPRGQDPAAVLANHPAEIAYTVGASSGESSAKAATAGKAAIRVASHGAAVGAVRAGKAKAAMVKNWWWEAHKDKFPGMDMYRIPGISIEKNPDNVLTASRAVPARVRQKISKAAIASKTAFGAPKMEPFDISRLRFSLGLMKKGGIDPIAYSW
jgi:ABC-type phosphate/phosphonate transport system substrate-binding protein